jgi:LacI family transcriptional regulator
MWSQQRAQSFSEKITNAGYTTKIYGRPLLKLKHSWESEQRLLAEWILSLPRPLGLMACNDDCGLQVIDACKLAGLHIPEDVGILGVDDDQLACDLADPPLSSIELNVERAGYDAAAMLDKMMKGENLKDKKLIIQPVRIVQRQSTDVLATEDKYIRMALRYIKNHDNEIVQVDDVANAVGMSRRTLEFKFRKVLRSSIYSMIKRIRIEYVSNLLVETDMTLIQIANKMGYTEAHNLSRQFKQEKKISPEDYRKKFRR